jgi:hypothetical protein
VKAGDLFMVQHCAEHGSFRVLPLRTCEDLARLDLEKGAAHSWVTLDHAADESDAYAKMKAYKANLRDVEPQEGTKEGEHG